MSQSPTVQITPEQLGRREIIVTDLLETRGPDLPASDTAVAFAPVQPLSVMGRKMVGHGH